MQKAEIDSYRRSIGLTTRKLIAVFCLLLMAAGPIGHHGILLIKEIRARQNKIQLHPQAHSIFHQHLAEPRDIGKIFIGITKD
jgi:hypothetical protein